MLGYYSNGQDEHAAYYRATTIYPSGASISENLSTGAVTVRNAAGNVIAGSTDQGYSPESPSDSTAPSAGAHVTPGPDPVDDEPEIELADDPGAGGLDVESPDATDQPFTTMSATPGGYTLFGGTRKSAYVYQSRDMEHDLNRCVITSSGESCTLKGSVASNFKQTMTGGASAFWTMRAHTWRITGPSYGATYKYYCGIDVNNGSDYTCNEVDDDAPKAYGPETFAVKSKSSVIESWGHRFPFYARNKRPFPMVKIAVSWPGYGTTVHIRYRGWDIAWSTNKSTWLLTKDAKY
ncbi:hypothetical protein ASD11_14980 [Aeromicrobium sp. Root495]|nr:hypothetical protein ASD11_14980 [Aeromicrobium sp. Root495]